MRFEAVAVNEVLHRAPGLLVFFARVFQKLEGRSELAMQLAVVITRHRQTAALAWKCPFGVVYRYND